MRRTNLTLLVLLVAAFLGLAIVGFCFGSDALAPWEISNYGHLDHPDGYAEWSSGGVKATEDGGWVYAGHLMYNTYDENYSGGGWDASVIKYGKDGQIEWQKTYGGYGEDLANGISVTNEGYYLLTRTNSTNIEGFRGGFDAVVYKLDTQGNVIWYKCLGGTSTEFPAAIATTRDGGCVICVNTQSTDGDVVGNHGGSDAWIVKLDANGNISWAKCFGGGPIEEWEGGYDFPTDIIETTSNDILFVGRTDSKNGDISSNKGSTDLWVVKLSSLGNLIWSKCYGGSDADTARSVKQTSEEEGFIISGKSFSSDGDVSGNHGGGDLWLLKIDAEGAVKWQRSLGGSGEEDRFLFTTWNTGRNIDICSDGGIVAGVGTLSTDGDISCDAGAEALWVLKVSQDGELAWQWSFSGTESLLGGLCVAKDRGLVVVGDNMNGSPGFYDSHSWLFKFTPTDGTLTVNIPSPPNGAKYIVNNCEYQSGEQVILNPGTYNVSFAHVEGFLEPTSFDVEIAKNNDTIISSDEYLSEVVSEEPVGGGANGGCNAISTIPSVGVVLLCSLVLLVKRK